MSLGVEKASMSRINKDISTIVSEEVFQHIGAPGCSEYVEYPEKGILRWDVLNFKLCELTRTLMKRKETSRFPIAAMFNEKAISGEPICELSDGTPAITIEDGFLKFCFHPFEMHLANLCEGLQGSKNSQLVNSALKFYWSVPQRIRNSMRWVVRKIKSRHIRTINDLDIIGASSNVIVHLIERHLVQEGLVKEIGQRAIAVITHDIDTQYCQSEGREVVSSTEEDAGVRSTWFFVPQSVQYSLDKQSIGSLMDQGHEIGMHGFRHDGRLALDDYFCLTKQISGGKRILKSVGADVEVFRSPWCLRSPLLHEVLTREGFCVDTSYPDVDTLGINRGRNGVSYNRPYRPFLIREGRPMGPLPIWEVPISSPQDVQLIEDLRVEKSDLSRIWRYKAEFCKDFGGVFVFLTHPIHISNHLEEYSQFIKFLRTEDFEISSLTGLASIYDSKVIPIDDSAKS